MAAKSALAMNRRSVIAGGSAALLGSMGLPGGARASSFPTQDIQVLLGVGPGGGTDRSARLLGPHWEAHLPGSRRVTYLPRPGAGGLVALEALMNGPSDGHLTMYYPAPHIAWMFTLDQVSGFTRDDVAWVGTLFSDPNVLLVPNDSPYETIADFIDAARTSDRPFTISGSTPLSNAHFATVLVREMTGANLRFVPFGGGGDARNAVAGGHVDGCIAPYWSALGVLELTKAIGIFKDHNPAPHLWQPVPANDVLDVTLPDLEEPYSMFCAASVRRDNPEAFDTLVSSFQSAVTSEDFREAAQAEDLTGFLVDWDGARTDAFVDEYVSLIEEYMPAMEADLADM